MDLQMLSDVFVNIGRQYATDPGRVCSVAVCDNASSEKRAFQVYVVPYGVDFDAWRAERDVTWKAAYDLAKTKRSV